jgi:hypothetical protein
MEPIEDKNDLMDLLDHYGHWGTEEELRAIRERVRGQPEHERILETMRWHRGRQAGGAK